MKHLLTLLHPAVMGQQWDQEVTVFLHYFYNLVWFFLKPFCPCKKASKKSHQCKKNICQHKASGSALMLLLCLKAEGQMVTAFICNTKIDHNCTGDFFLSVRLCTVSKVWEIYINCFKAEVEGLSKHIIAQ